MINEKNLLYEMQIKKDELKSNAPFNDEFCRGFAFAMEFVKQEPTVEAEPVVHGRWIFGTANHREYMKCSECLHSQTPTGVFVYCPNCGAKMDKENEA